jgi:hypothetical protein
MHIGCLPFMHFKNVLKTHLNDSMLSSPISTTPKIVDCKWLFMPTNTARGMWNLFDLYVVSNVMQSLKSTYAALQLAFAQKYFDYFVLINIHIRVEFIILRFHFIKELEQLLHVVR